LIFWKYSSRQI